MSDHKYRREFLKATALGTASLMVPSCVGQFPSFGATPGSVPLPNIIIIFTDDQGYADVGCYGADGFETPNLDRMADEGVKFTDFFVAQSACSPSRAALLTGCYPNRIGLPHNLAPSSIYGINDSETTIAELARERGYTTAIYGKWHLGDHPAFLPTRHGFDEFFGLPYSHDMWPGSRVAELLEGPGFQWPDLPLMLNEQTIEYNPDHSQLITWCTDRAVEFIERNKDRPFFLYVPHSMPHVPLAVSDKFKGKSPQGLYGDVMMEIDWSVGRILAALKKHRLDDRTLVIFTSDQGPWLRFGDHQGSARPLREGKGTTWEGGIRVPCIMRWPGRIPDGSVCREPAMTIDLLPTIAAIVGAELPQHKIDGKNIWPLMSEPQSAVSPHDVFYFYHGQELQAVRRGRWKLHLPHKYPTVRGAPGKNGMPAPDAFGYTDLALYNLHEDVSEQHNVADQHPGVVEHLLTFAERAREDLGDSATDREGKNCRPPGRVRGESASNATTSPRIALVGAAAVGRQNGHHVVTITEIDGGLRVEADGQMLTEYWFKDVPRPYFYPVVGPTGDPVIRHWPMKEGENEEQDHVHHRSLWFTHGDVNGHDFWTEEEGFGSIVHDTFIEVTSGSEVGTIRSCNNWVAADGQLVCTDSRTHRFWSVPQGWMMDFDITIRASHGNLVFGDTKEGSMAIRLAPTMRVVGEVGQGHIVNSEGHRDDDAWGKRAAWCDCHGPVNGKLVGVAIFEHPSNARHPTWWHVREYGLFAANPFGIHDFEHKPKGTGDLKVPAGESVTFRYRLYFHRGDEKDAAVAERYREYAAEKLPG